MALKPDDSIGPYVLIRQLGRGAFGEVWLARHHHLNEERAVKVPTNADYVRQLRTEAQIQFRLNHPNIVRTLDLMPDYEPPYYVMEYVPGVNLRQKLRASGKLPLAEARGIIRQILLALEHAHAVGVCHRDLKPENILCQANGVVKVTDFGFGKVQAALVPAMIFSGSVGSAGGGTITGTVQYMSPQQQAGEGADPKDDLYAVGVIACELLTGSRPQPMGVAKMLERAGVGAGFATVLERSMEQDRKDRYASAAFMRDALDNFSARSAITSQQAQNGRPAAPMPSPMALRGSPAMGIIRFECGCGKRIQVAARFAGTKGKCSACGSHLVVPSQTGRGPEQPFAAPLEFPIFESDNDELDDLARAVAHQAPRGDELYRTSANSYLDDLRRQLADIDTELRGLDSRKLFEERMYGRHAARKAAIIEMFSVPNNKEAILELLSLSTSNGDRGFSNQEAYKLRPAWRAKAKHMLGMARIFAERDAEYRRIVARFEATINGWPARDRILWMWIALACAAVLTFLFVLTRFIK